MGLVSKIEEKLSGGSSKDKEEPSTLQTTQAHPSSDVTSSGPTSHIQHPIQHSSSRAPDGTYTTDRSALGGSSNVGGVPPAATSTVDSSGGHYGVDRDEYGERQQKSGLMDKLTPGNHGPSSNDRNEYGERQQSGGMMDKLTPGNHGTSSNNRDEYGDRQQSGGMMDKLTPGNHGNSSNNRDEYGDRQQKGGLMDKLTPGNSSNDRNEYGDRQQKGGLMDKLTPGNHGNSSNDRDEYGERQQKGGLMDKLTPGNHGSSRNESEAYSTQYPSGGIPDRTVGGGNTIPSGQSTGPREPYDPYSSKGQRTAANATTGTHEGIAHKRDGVIMNSSDDPRYGSTSHREGDTIPSAGGQKLGGVSGAGGPYESTTGGQHHHYGRDAALAGTAGAGGLGAYEVGKDHSSTRDHGPTASSYDQHSTSNIGHAHGGPTSHQQHQHTSTHNTSHATNPSNVSYMNRQTPDAGTAAIDSKIANIPAGSKVSGSTLARRMGEAYEAGWEAGYRAAQSEMST